MPDASFLLREFRDWATGPSHINKRLFAVCSAIIALIVVNLLVLEPRPQRTIYPTNAPAAGSGLGSPHRLSVHYTFDVNSPISPFEMFGGTLLWPGEKAGWTSNIDNAREAVHLANDRSETDWRMITKNVGNPVDNQHYSAKAVSARVEPVGSEPDVSAGVAIGVGDASPYIIFSIDRNGIFSVRSKSGTDPDDSSPKILRRGDKKRSLPAKLEIENLKGVLYLSIDGEEVWQVDAGLATGPQAGIYADGKGDFYFSDIYIAGDP